MTVGELKERIEELNLPSNTEVIFYDPQIHEALLVDTAETGLFDPSKEEFVIHFVPDEHVGIPCLALYI